jgi:hypothetical protein
MFAPVNEPRKVPATEGGVVSAEPAPCSNAFFEILAAIATRSAGRLAAGAAATEDAEATAMVVGALFSSREHAAVDDSAAAMIHVAARAIGVDTMRLGPRGMASVRFFETGIILIVLVRFTVVAMRKARPILGGQVLTSPLPLQKFKKLFKWLLAEKKQAEANSIADP